MENESRQILVISSDFSDNSKWRNLESRELDGKVGIFLTSVIYVNVHNGQANRI